MKYLKAKLNKFVGGSSAGFTLAEVLVNVGLLAITMSLMGGGLFSALGVQRFWSQDATATKELRHAASWFSRDALNAQTTNLVDGAPAESSITINWTSSSGVSYSASYTLEGTELRRSYNGGAQTTLARHVVSVGFSRSGNTLKFSLNVTASQGGTDSQGLDVYARMLL